jgi:hypothetical protein
MVDRGNSIAIEIHDSLGQNLFDHSLHRPMHRPMHRHDFRQSIDRLFSQKSTRVHSETRTHNLRGLHHPHLSEWLTTAPLKNPVPFEINRPTTYLSPSNSRLLQSDTASLASRGSSNVYNQNQKFSTNTLHINFLKDGLHQSTHANDVIFLNQVFWAFPSKTVLICYFIKPNDKL